MATRCFCRMAGNRKLVFFGKMADAAKVENEHRLVALQLVQRRRHAIQLRLVSQTFAWALAGQVVIAVAQPLVLNAMTKTATGYLPEPERPTGIAVASAGQFLGAAVGLAMGPLLAGKDDLGPLLPVQAALSLLAGPREAPRVERERPVRRTISFMVVPFFARSSSWRSDSVRIT